MEPDKYFQAIGYVFAAIIAGGVAFIVAVLSKELKTSEFRQAWIDGLRADISEIVASSMILSGAIIARKNNGMSEPDIIKFIYERHDDFMSIRTLQSRILLRLNPKEHVKLIAAINALLAADEQMFEDGAIERKNKIIEEVMAESQVVLKYEWKRVKRGENVFQQAKKISLCIVKGGIAIVAIWGINILVQYAVQYANSPVIMDRISSLSILWSGHSI